MASLPEQSDRKFTLSCVPLASLRFLGGRLGTASVRFSTGIRSASEQTLRVCTCLPCTFENHHQIIRKLICDMHRPVKNRDGGPIAGVAFNGGGGSRQLGPDDNDPVSATHIPEASNHTIPPSPTQPINNIHPFFISNFKWGLLRSSRPLHYLLLHHFQFWHHL